MFYFIPRGPSGTSFEFGVFVTRLHFPTDYPLSPPKMKFVSEIFHPNGKNKIFQKKMSIIEFDLISLS
jgi:ubiquitin-protein ligase